MHRWSPLNDRQRELLRRLDADEEPGVASAERLSAYALRDRGLLVVVRRGGAVRTEVTGAGKFYLEHGHHPEDPRYAAEPPETGKKTPMPYSERPAARVWRAKAAELIERLVAERRVVIPEPDEATEAEYRQVIDYAKRHNLARPGSASRSSACGAAATSRSHSKTARTTTRKPRGRRMRRSSPCPPNCAPCIRW
ncbi:hypothetical protein [Streptomyces sp. ISL-43]|uniref:hypothetical protein n=1 Tax=Streptomyces sp. ISL-43 TaxID=2819183 RepID=UPI002035FB1F|nr:hypothetical protein [Streptomyces sp. ISL-43]